MTACALSAADYPSVSDAVIAGLAAGGMPVFVPPGEWPVCNLLISAPMKLFGAGMGVTKLLVDATAADGVVVSSGFVELSGFDVTTSVPAPKRTGYGVKITGGSNVLVRQVRSNGHRFGFYNSGGGNEFEFCTAAGNHVHGMAFGDGILPQNEIGIYKCQSNNNGGDGFCLIGPGLGVFMDRPTAAANGGNGIRLVNPTPANAGNAIADVFMSEPELSANHLWNFDSSQNQGGGGISIFGGLCEDTNGLYAGQGTFSFNVEGMFIQGGPHGIVFDGFSGSITGCTFRVISIAAVRAGVHSGKLALSGLVGTDWKAGSAGLLVDAGAQAIVGSAVNFTGAPVIHNALPAGSMFTASPGF